MATLQMSENSKAAHGRTQTHSPRVDLTAMVDLAFLLITFFMLTSSLSKMHQLDVAKPVESTQFSHYPASRTMTILLGKRNKAVYYMGEAKNAVMKTVNLSGIGKQLRAGKAQVAKAHHTIRDQVMLVIIKPTAGAKYKNFVDILDEMTINSILSYTIDDNLILEAEKQYMKSQSI